jgi:hypothetical protein
MSLKNVSLSCRLSLSHSLTKHFISHPLAWAYTQPWPWREKYRARQIFPLARTTDQFGPRQCVTAARRFFARERAHCEIGLSKGRE